MVGPPITASHHRYSDTAGDPHSPLGNQRLVVPRRLGPGQRYTTRPTSAWSATGLLPRTALAQPPALGAGPRPGGGLLPGRGLERPGVGLRRQHLLFYHATFTVNSLCHLFGSRRYATTDDSRNNWFVALITLGEGWHNNHHHYQSSASQGFFWWEIDVSYYVIRLLGLVGLVWDIRKPSPNKLAG